MTGIGNSHIAIKATPEAQAWFDQGLTPAPRLLGLRIGQGLRAGHPHRSATAPCATGGWRRRWSFAAKTDKIYADKALDQAVKLEGKASKTDRLYIEAAVAESHEDGDDTQSIALYRKLVKKEPHDIEARIFLANAVGTASTTTASPNRARKKRSRFSKAC